MAMIARLNVRTVIPTVRIAEYSPTRFEVVDDNSVSAAGLSSLVISLSLQLLNGWEPCTATSENHDVSKRLGEQDR